MLSCAAQMPGVLMRFLTLLCAHVFCSSAQLSSANPILQAVLQKAAMAGITPRELGVVALSCLAALEGQGGQVVGLLPHHVSGALRAWLQQMDGRVSAREAHMKGKFYLLYLLACALQHRYQLYMLCA
jgi:hypothetical protein